MMRLSTFRRKAALAAIPPALMAAGIVLSGGAGVGAQDVATPTAIGVVEVTDGLAECAPSELGALPEDTEAGTVYTIVPEESEARYRVLEVLAEVGENEAVGATQAIVGQIGFDAEGLPVACSRFDVDMRTLQSDQSRRDNYLYQNTLEAETFPLATFVLRGVEGLEAPLAEGEETTITLIGDLTLRDVTQLVGWEATVTHEGDTLTGTAVTEFEMPDFSIEQPRVPVVLSVDETIRLEIDLTAARG